MRTPYLVPPSSITPMQQVIPHPRGPAAAQFSRIWRRSDRACTFKEFGIAFIGPDSHADGRERARMVDEVGRAVGCQNVACPHSWDASLRKSRIIQQDTRAGTSMKGLSHVSTAEAPTHCGGRRTSACRLGQFRLVDFIEGR